MFSAKVQLPKVSDLVRRDLDVWGEAVRKAPARSVRQALDSPSSALDADARSFLEPRLGHDFSKVRIHAGDVAAGSARTLGARAYTVGRNVVFAAGHYAPGTSAGRMLLAHELTHVAQQTRGAVVGRPVGGVKLSDPTDGSEREAEAVARSVMTVGDRRASSLPRQRQEAGVRPGAGVVQRAILLEQMTGEVTRPTLDQVKTWLGSAGYTLTPHQTRQIADIVASTDNFGPYHWAYGQKELMRALATPLAHHEQFLAEFEELKTDVQFKLFPLIHHEEMVRGGAAHYRELDPVFRDREYVWRFTSNPSQEFISVAAGVTPKTVMQLVAQHSGGAEKSNPDVITLSFGRNIGALFGTAMSSGGDPHVLNIIDKAAYLCGLRISALPRYGITAHPAMGRGISLFETEYVLIGTPGRPRQSLSQLPHVIFHNPFRGEAGEIGRLMFKKSLDSVENAMQTTVEVVEAAAMPPKMKAKILKEATLVAQVASKYKDTVATKNYISTDPHAEESAGEVFDRIQQFVRDLTALRKASSE